MYEAKEFSSLLGMESFSNEILNDHFKLYKGYVANVNKVMCALHKLEKDCTAYAELKRRFGWEFNGMRLHELYFENLTKDKKKISENLKKEFAKEFGSFEEWKKDFKSVGSMRGIGWVVLVYDSSIKKMFNVWINEHDLGFPAGTVPLLVMDVFEHAFIRDYGLNKKDYIEAFIKNIDWEAVEKRLV